MKHLILLVTFISTISVFSQDLVIKRNGDTLKVNITKSTPDLIEFTYPKENTINSEYKNSLEKIIYASGRIEICSQEKKLAIVKGKEDWEKVQITTNPKDVEGLTKLGEVVGKSGWGGFAAQGLGDRKAREWIKKNAATIGASIVLLQEKADTFGVKLVGIAYK